MPTQALTYRLIEATDIEHEDDELECVEHPMFYIQLGFDGIFAVNRSIYAHTGRIIGADHLGVFEDLASAKRCLEQHVQAANPAMEAGSTQIAVFTIDDVRYRGQIEWLTHNEVGVCKVYPPIPLEDGAHDSDAVVPRAICEIVNVGCFSVGDSDPLFGFAVEGVKWNGFDCPYLPLSSVKQLAEITKRWRDEIDDDSIEVVHVGNDGRVYVDSEFGTDEVKPSQLLAHYEPLYLIGAHAWTWQEEKPHGGCDA